jgi:hypothetical protein
VQVDRNVHPKWQFRRTVSPQLKRVVIVVNHAKVYIGKWLVRGRHNAARPRHAIVFVGWRRGHDVLDRLPDKHQRAHFQNPEIK